MLRSNGAIRMGHVLHRGVVSRGGEGKREERVAGVRTVRCSMHVEDTPAAEELTCTSPTRDL